MIGSAVAGLARLIAGGSVEWAERPTWTVVRLRTLARAQARVLGECSSPGVP